MPGTIAWAMASPASDKRRNTKNAPTGAIETLKTDVATKARCIKSYSSHSNILRPVMLQEREPFGLRF